MRGSVRYRCGSWHYRLDLGTLGGKRQQKEKGGFRTKAEADGELAKVLSVYYDTGTYLQDAKMTFEEVYLEFIETECPSTREYATIVKYKSIYTNHCLEAFAPFPMYTITTKKIQKHIFEWSKLYSYDFATGMYHFLFGLFAFAKRKNYIKINPVLDVISPKKPRGYEEVKFYT